MTLARPAGSATIAALLLHARCNMTCTFCVTEDELEAMRFEEARALLDGLVARGFTSVILGGGEPFAGPGDLLALAAEARARGLLVQVGTNAIALPGGFERLDCFDRWILPLESTRSDVHDLLRHHGPGHHALVLERLATLRAAGRAVTVSTVLTAHNTPGLEELARFLADYCAQGGQLHAWHLYQFLPFGRGGTRHRDELEIPAEAYHDACERIAQLALPFRVYQRTNMYRPSSIKFFWKREGRIESGPSPEVPAA